MEDNERNRAQLLGELALLRLTLQGKFAGCVVALVDITERKHAEQVILEQTRNLAVADERNRLARELHDSVTQSMYSMTLFSETARQLLQTGNEERLEYYLTRLGRTSQQALKEMRLLVHELRPAQLEEEGLIRALQQRLDAVEQRAGIDGRLITRGTLNMPPSFEFELYRVAQEALNNSLKHAFATAVTVKLTADGPLVRMEVQDNGKGFDLESSPTGGGMGLVNMRHRAQSIFSQTDLGTTVEITVNCGALDGDDSA
jgi:signal transduction histidine kinase